MMFKDLVKAMLFILAGLGLVYAFLNARISSIVLKVSFVALVVIDLWIVDYKPMDMKDLRQQTQVLQETDAVRAIKADKSLYRILPLDERFSSNWYVYFGLQGVGGYHPAKLKLYDDLLRRAMFPDNIMNTNLINFLNVKYIIPQSNNSGGKSQVSQNPGCLPRAFFVNEYRVMPDNKQLFELIKTKEYNPARIAYLEKDIGVKLDSTDNSTVRFTSYNINDFSLDVNATGTNLLKMSEVYYPSGWRAMVDGKEIEILKTDYAFRAIIVPPGKHTIKFEFAPISYKAGLIATSAGNYLVAIVLLYYLGIYVMQTAKRRKQVQATDR
jgi:hypothetical protein